MSLGHSYDEHMHDEVVSTEASSVREPVGVAQIFNAAMGVFFIVVGAIGLARTGFDSLTSGSVEVAGLGQTALLALIHLFIGVVALACAISRPAARSAAMILGASLIALGIIALIEPIREMGWDSANGAIYLIIGALSIVAAVVTPVVAIGERRVARAGRYVA